MSRKYIATVIGILMVLGTTLPPGLALAVPSRPLPEYLALGDSWAVGIGATAPEQVGYVGRVNNLFFRRSQRGPDVLTNLGVIGERSGTFISGGGQLDRAVAAIAGPNDVKLVTVDIGGNDLLALIRPGEPCFIDPTSVACQVALGAALVTFAGNYAIILGTLNAALAADPGDESLLVMTFPNILRGTGSPFEAAIDQVLVGIDGVIDCPANINPFNVGLNDLIACIGGLAGATTVDVFPLFDDDNAQALFAEDGIHPNNKGHKVVAKAFIEAAQ